LDVKRFSRAADSYWRLRGALQDYDSPVNKIKRPLIVDSIAENGDIKYRPMDLRDFNRRIASLSKCEAAIMREMVSIKTGLK
jgi:hypothetical protein